MSAEESCLAGAIEAAAEDVPDPRSLELKDGRLVRLAGIEPFDLLRPEDGQAAAMALKERMEALVAGAPLAARFVAETPDRYGRRPAMIVVGDTLLQETLAFEGLAIAFASGDPLPCFRHILAAEQDARASGRGFWAGMPIPEANPAALAGHVGRFAIFAGEIMSVGNRSTRTYLNFGTYWRQDVTVEIAAADRERFGGEAALAALAGRRVRVRGYLEEKSGPMMQIRWPSQIEVLQDGPGPLPNGP